MYPSQRASGRLGTAVCLVVAGAAGVASTSVATTTAARTSPPAAAITASRETVADPFRLGTEPNIAVSPDGTIYESPIFGFSTTQSFVQRSDDGGQTFNVLGLPGVGKQYGSGAPSQPTCSGGGDSDLATTPLNDLYMIDLGGEPNVPAWVTSDHGNNFTAVCEANDEKGLNHFTDRQWLSTDTVHNLEWFIYRDGLATSPLDSAGHGYGEYIKSAPLRTAEGGTAGAQQLLFTSLCSDAAGADATCFSDVQIAGNAVTDNYGTYADSAHRGNTYLAMTTNDGVAVAVINPDMPGKVVERTAVAGASSVLFPTVAVDRAGTVYEAYVDSSSYEVELTRSTDQGVTWSDPVTINTGPVTTAVMPWIVAGDPGRVDLVFYGSGGHQDPTGNSGPWNVYMAQSLDATRSAPHWTQTRMTDRPNHVDPICLSGLGCTTDTSTSGDRQLGDFFRVALDAQGRAVISFADGDNRLGSQALTGPAPAPSFAGFVRQATGPSLYARVGNVPPIATPTNGVTRGAHHDPVPFTTPAGPGQDIAALNLESSSMSYVDGSHLGVHMVIRNLDPVQAITAPALPNATYMTRWWYSGEVYFAAAEDNGGQWRYFSGHAAPVSDGAAIKYAYYPANGTATGSVKPGADGSIDITVPTDQVGSPAAGATLYSATAYTLTHALPTLPSAPSASGFDFPQIADVLPAYNVVAGSHGHGTAAAHGAGTAGAGATSAILGASSAAASGSRTTDAVGSAADATPAQSLSTRPAAAAAAIPPAVPVAALAVLALAGLALRRRSSPPSSSRREASR